MLRQAVRASWYQHIAHGRLVSSLPSRRVFSSVSGRSLDYGGPNDKVFFYEQNTPGSDKRRRIDPEAEVREERREVEDELSRLDQELQEGPYGPNSWLMKNLPEKDRAIALEAIRRFDETEEGQQLQREQKQALEAVFDDELDEALREEFEGLALERENWMSEAAAEGQPEPQTSRGPYEVVLLDDETHPYIDRFNDHLRRFANDKSNESLRQRLWKWYRRCKMVVGTKFLESIPEEAADLMWESQAQGKSTGVKSTRSAHLRTLFSDAAAVDRPQPASRVLLYIESLYDGGETGEALDLWETCQKPLAEGMDDLETYWKLGVHLFAADGNPQRAQDIALAFLSNDQSREPRILLPVIAAWGRKPGKEAGVKAWALYLQLKTLLGSRMTMADYDDISISFLKARRPDLALAVFKDMMVTGQDPKDDSQALYKAFLGVAGNLQMSSISEEEVNRVSLSALTILPRRFQNRFFYASWMKKLIGMGEVDSAALVVELMYERGLRPDAKHLNGLIAAWLREGSLSGREKMERLGWAMIHERIEMVSERTGPPRSSPTSQSNKATNQTDPSTHRRVPPATIETFCILLLRYTRRGEDDKIQALAQCLVDARLKPNSYFMNHLLYDELRKQDISTLWRKFENMTATVKPDLETFACLWDCAKVQYDDSRAAFSESFPSARGLYSEMMQWYSQLTDRDKSRAQEEFSKELYDQVIRCFCLSKDLTGTLVALHSMSASFNLFPDDMTARIVILLVARIAAVPEGTPSRRLRRLKSTPRKTETIARVRDLVYILSERKAAFLEENGLDVEQLDPHEKQQYQLEILSDLLLTFMNRVNPDVNQEIAHAGSQMSVPTIHIGSALGEENEENSLL